VHPPLVCYVMTIDAVMMIESRYQQLNSLLHGRSNLRIAYRIGGSRVGPEALHAGVLGREQQRQHVEDDLHLLLLYPVRSSPADDIPLHRIGEDLHDRSES